MEFEMELTWLPWLIVWVLSLTAFLSVLWIQHRRHLSELERLTTALSSSTEASRSLSSEMVHEQSQLLDKVIGLVAAADPLAFQQIQAMSPSGYDEPTPGDPEDEPIREDELSGAEQDFLNDVFDAPGNEFLGAVGDRWPVSSSDPAPGA
jgi:HAMP domain-containing protein